MFQKQSVNDLSDSCVRSFPSQNFCFDTKMLSPNAPFLNSSRRVFLQSLFAGAASVSVSARVFANARGSNDAIRIGAIGFNGRGMGNIKGLLEVPGVRVTAMCDVDSAVLSKGKEAMEKAGQQVEVYSDLRRLLDSKEVDAVMIATPNHWHCLAAIWAMQAGKDVYVEKPLAHTLWEGKQLVAAVRSTGAILQTGTQSRSSPALREAHAWAKAGNLGKLVRAHGTCFKRRPSIGKVSEAQAVPSNVDYNLWSGPAQMSPVMRKQFHYDWHWMWETGNGDLGNQGVHQADIARWFMDEHGLPPAVMSVGGRFGYVDDGQTPNTQLVAFPYEKAPLYFEVRGLPSKAGDKTMDVFRGSGIGVVLQYERGHILIPSYTAAVAFDEKGEVLKRFGRYQLPGEAPVVEPKVDGASASKSPTHHSNFIDAVRSRDAARLNCDGREGELSSALCSFAGISHRLGSQFAPEAAREQMKADAYASETWGRMLEHLKLNEALPERAVLGATLKIDRVKEVIVGNAAATVLERRQDRAPFTVPQLA